LALRPADVTNLVARARRSDQLCLINHQLRFHPAIVSARNAIRSGRIGRCVHVTADYWTNRYVDPAADKRAWWFDRNQGGGMFWAMGTHLADLVRFCLDREPVRIRGCSADTLLPSASGPGGRRFPVTAESMFAALLECGGGTSIILQATGVAFNGASGLSVVFRGDRGELRFDSPGRLTLSDLETRDARGRTLRTPKAGETNVFETAFREFAGVLIRAVRSDRPALLSDACTFQDYAASHQVVSAMRRSAARSRPTTGTRPG
jgi:predicted dehydrogenase